MAIAQMTTSRACHVTRVKHLVISHSRTRKDEKDCKYGKQNIFVVIGDNPHYLKHLSDYLPLGTLGSVASLLAAILYQRIPDRKHKL
jgi:hypothetical protein